MFLLNRSNYYKTIIVKNNIYNNIYEYIFVANTLHLCTPIPNVTNQSNSYNMIFEKQLEQKKCH